jgi:enoyl-CoA hydratase/carnithine racemase
MSGLNKTIVYEKIGKVAVITLNRIEHHNAFNQAMMKELDEVWQSIKTDPLVVSVVLTGAGDKSFCTGMDLSELAAGKCEEMQGLSRDDSPMFKLTAIHQKCWKPVITAVNGMVCGGGLHFIADSDLVIAADNATFFDNHVKVGLVAGLEPVGLARRIPLEAVLRMALLGGSERMTADEAKQLGLVGEVLPLDQLMSRAMSLAEKISKHSPTALAHSKKAIWNSLNMGLEQALSHAWKTILEHNDSPDFKEGAQAFMERRIPNWSGMPEI